MSIDCATHVYSRNHERVFTWQTINLTGHKQSNETPTNNRHFHSFQTLSCMVHAGKSTKKAFLFWRRLQLEKLERRETMPDTSHPENSIIDTSVPACMHLVAIEFSAQFYGKHESASPIDRRARRRRSPVCIQLESLRARALSSLMGNSRRPRDAITPEFYIYSLTYLAVVAGEALGTGAPARGRADSSVLAGQRAHGWKQITMIVLSLLHQYS